MGETRADSTSVEQRLIVRLWCGDVPDTAKTSHAAYLANLPDDERAALLAALDDPEYVEWVNGAPNRSSASEGQR